MTAITQILRNNTFLGNQRVGLAVSGGIDSMVMLHLFNKYREEKNIDLYVLHYNHHWRKESNNDAKFLRNYCKKNKISFIYKEGPKKQIEKNEEYARNERYSFFAHCARKYNLNIICTAHHKDDQAETIIFRLARGTGPQGLLPIKELSKLTSGVILYRPLINISKDEIYKYALKYKIKYRVDKTNFDEKYKRNLLRLKYIPVLKKINKNVESNIINCCDLIYSQNKVLDNYFLTLLRKLSTDKIARALIISLDRKKILKLDDHTKKTFLYWLLSRYKVKGNVNKLESLISAIDGKKKIDISKDYLLNVNDKNVSLEYKQRQKNNNKDNYSKINFTLNGSVNKILFNKTKYILIKPFKAKHFEQKFPKDKENTAYANLANYKNKQLTIRFRESSDVIKPLGMSNVIKLKKYLINKKVLKEKRYNLPLICFKKEVLWIPGYCISENIKIVDTPTHIMRLEN